MERRTVDGAGGGGRTHMTSEGRGILSPVRLPVPPLRQLAGSFEFTPTSLELYCNASWTCPSQRRYGALRPLLDAPRQFRPPAFASAPNRWHEVSQVISATHCRLTPAGVNRAA